jgi:hypothetical protein
LLSSLVLLCLGAGVVVYVFQVPFDAANTVLVD